MASDKPAAPSRPAAPASPLKTAYLVLYNFASAVLWATVLGRTAIIASVRGPALVGIGVSTFTRWTQTLAVLEILHSASGELAYPLPAVPPRTNLLSS